MSSELRVDKIVPTDGVSNGGGGGIIQVCQSTKQDAQTININSTAAQDIAGTDQNGNGSVFCVKIAPKFASSKILFSCHFTVGMGGGASYIHFNGKKSDYSSTFNSWNWKYGERNFWFKWNRIILLYRKYEFYVFR